MGSGGDGDFSAALVRANQQESEAHNVISKSIYLVEFNAAVLMDAQSLMVVNEQCSLSPKPKGLLSKAETAIESMGV